MYHLRLCHPFKKSLSTKNIEIMLKQMEILTNFYWNVPLEQIWIKRKSLALVLDVICFDQFYLLTVFVTPSMVSILVMFGLTAKFIVFSEIYTMTFTHKKILVELELQKVRFFSNLYEKCIHSYLKVLYTIT